MKYIPQYRYFHTKSKPRFTTSNSKVHKLLDTNGMYKDCYTNGILKCQKDNELRRSVHVCH